MKYTLEQLQEFTDTELSEAVFAKLFPDVEKIIRLSPPSTGCGGLAWEGSDFTRVFFDINNWSDMGALANKHKINAICNADGSLWDAFDDSSEADVWHENELRAKAIVFLMRDI